MTLSTARLEKCLDNFREYLVNICGIYTKVGDGEVPGLRHYELR